MRQEDLMAMLRENGPMTARQIADAVYDGRSDWDSVRNKINGNIRMLAKYGIVRKYELVEKHGFVESYSWELAE